MRLKTSKIISFSTILLFFSIGQTSDALNYSNNLQIYEDSKELLAKEGGIVKRAQMRRNSPILIKWKIIKTLWKRQQKKDMRFGKRIKTKIKIKSDKTFQNNFERLST